MIHVLVFLVARPVLCEPALVPVVFTLFMAIHQVTVMMTNILMMILLSMMAMFPVHQVCSELQKKKLLLPVTTLNN